MANTLQVNYDLTKPARDYERLYTYLKRFDSCARPLQSMWLVRTDKSATTVRDEIDDFVDSDDEILVFDVTRDSWASNFSDDTTAWMKSNMGHVRTA